MIPQQKLGTHETFASIGIQLEGWRGGLGKAILQTFAQVSGSKVRFSVTVLKGSFSPVLPVRVRRISEFSL